MIRGRKLFTLNSRDSLTTDKFTVKLDLPSHHNFNRICLVQASFPKSWYTVQSGHNTFTLTEGKESVQVMIEPANYNRKSLASTLATELTNISPNSYSYSVTYPNSNVIGDDGKYLFSVLDSDDQVPLSEISLSVSSKKDSNMFELLGFEPSSSNKFTSGTLKSKNVIKVQAEDVIRVHCNVCDNGGDDILLEVYGNSNPMFSNVVWQCPDIRAYSKPLSNKNTNLVDFFLTNEDNQYVELNGLNYCIQVLLYEEYLP